MVWHFVVVSLLTFMGRVWKSFCLVLLLCPLIAISLDIAPPIQDQGGGRRQLLIFGSLGSVGSQVSSLAKPSFSRVVGTVRDINDIRKNDKDILYIPINDITESDIIQATHILIAMPFVQESSSLWHTVLEHFFNSSSEENPKWLGMVSTSGVYGNHDGAWVSEESELRCSPKSSAFAYQEWEKEFEQASARSKCTNVRIFRCSGIYDSSKSALHTVWKSGFEKPNGNRGRGNTKTNRIHSFDIAQAIVASMRSTISGTPGYETLFFRIYNLADDCPAPRNQVLEYAYNLLTDTGKTPPRIQDDREGSVASSTTTRARRRENERKLIDNKRMKEELLPELTFPSYKEGLQAILIDPKAPWNQE